MRESEPVIQTMSVTQVRENWSKTLRAVVTRRTRIVLEKAGVPVAVLISPQDLERLRRYEAERTARFSVIDRMRESLTDVPDEELEREVASAVSDVRAEMRAEHEQAARTV